MSEHQDFLDVFLSHHFAIQGEGFGDSPPPDVIHELDQQTAELRDDLRVHGLELSDTKVAATLAFVVSYIVESVQEAIEEHSEECELDGDCDVSALLAFGSIEHFAAVAGVMLRDALSHP